MLKVKYMKTRAILTNNLDLRNEIIKQLKDRNTKYGKPYCPCVLPTVYTDDDICPCKAFRDMCENNVVGECHCGLRECVAVE